jgi:hypothetical protein
MNDTRVEFEQTDEQTLTYKVSDEALEAAASTWAGGDRDNVQLSVCPPAADRFFPR